MDAAVVIMLEADDLFRDSIGQDLVEPLDAVEDAGKGQGAAVAIGIVGSEVGGQLTGVFHELIADEGEVCDVGVG